MVTIVWTTAQCPFRRRLDYNDKEIFLPELIVRGSGFKDSGLKVQHRRRPQATSLIEHDYFSPG
jgi:hypothetical protein